MYSGTCLSHFFSLSLPPFFFFPPSPLLCGKWNQHPLQMFWCKHFRLTKILRGGCNIKPKPPCHITWMVWKTVDVSVFYISQSREVHTETAPRWLNTLANLLISCWKVISSYAHTHSSLFFRITKQAKRWSPRKWWHKETRETSSASRCEITPY